MKSSPNIGITVFASLEYNINQHRERRLNIVIYRFHNMAGKPLSQSTIILQSMNVRYEILALGELPGIA